MRLSLPCLLALSLTTATVQAQAQAQSPPPPPRSPAPDPAKVVHKVEKLAESVYCIFGQGGNIGLVVTSEYAVLIDDQFEPLVPGLLAAIKTVTTKPIKYLINTHFHGDHTGGNRALEKQVVAIVAHSNTRKRMEEAQAQPKDPTPRGGLPELSMGDSDPQSMARLDIHLGGTEFHLVHYKAGHTDGDVIVGLPQSHVMHMGDLFFNKRIPVIDLKHGGSLAGMQANVDWVLSFIPEDTKIIPGHGEVATKKDLQRFHDFLVAVQKHLAQNKGKTAQQLNDSFDHKAWSDYQDFKPFLTWERFFGIVSGEWTCIRRRSSGAARALEL